MSEWKKFKARMMEDSEFRREYEELGPAFELASKLIELRRVTGLTQQQIAELAGMTQPEVARMESGAANPTWETLSRLLTGVGAELELKVRDRDGRLVRV